MNWWNMVKIIDRYNYLSIYNLSYVWIKSTIFFIDENIRWMIFKHILEYYNNTDNLRTLAEKKYNRYYKCLAA